MLLVLSALQAVAVRAAPAESLTLGVIADDNIGRSPVPELLQKLLAEGGEHIRFVERNDLERALRELELTAMFAADRPDARSKLGQLVHADVLVLLRRSIRKSAETPPVESFDVVVSETSFGLRLCVRSLVRTRDPQADAGLARDLVGAALTKRRESLRELIAVPPLVSKELTFEYEHYGRTYSRMLEQMFLNQPGVLVVELAEAQAVGRELAVVGANRLRRPLPLYLLGSFRHAVQNDPDHITLSLSLRRGDTEIDRREKERLTQAQAPQWLRAAASELVNAVHKTDAAPADPRAEARQLVERAGQFSRINDWDEALTYYEASLLLEPENAEAHYLALQAIVAQRYRGANPLLKPAGPAQRELLLRQERFRRGEDHLVAFYRLANPATDKTPACKYDMTSGAPRDFLRYFEFSGAVGTPQPDSFHDFLQRERPKLYARLVPVLLDKGERRIDDGSLPVLMRVLLTVQPGQTLAENFATRADVVMKFAWKTDIDRVLFLLAPNDRELGVLPETVTFWETLAKCPQKTVAFLAKDWLASYRSGGNPYASGPATRPQTQPRRNPTTGPAPNVIFEPITLRAVGSGVFSEPRTPLTWVALSKNTDLLWGELGVWLMREAGLLVPLTIPGGERITSMCADDATVWVICGGRRPVVKAVDRASGAVSRIGPDDGLPAFDDASACCAGPDRICLVGRLRDPDRKGEGRSWIAWVSRGGGAKGGPIVSVFHEARDAESHFGRDAFRETTVSFRPQGCFALSAPDDPASIRRVLVRRADAPLLIEVPAGKVSVLSQPLSRFTTPELVDHTLYWIGEDATYRTRKEDAAEAHGVYSLNGTMAAPVRLMPYPYFIELAVLYGGCVHAINPSDNTWYIAKAYDGAFRPLTFESPKFVNRSFVLFHSNHYGLVASNRPGYVGTGLYAIRFRDVPELLTQNESPHVVKDH